MTEDMHEGGINDDDENYYEHLNSIFAKSAKSFHHETGDLSMDLLYAITVATGSELTLIIEKICEGIVDYINANELFSWILSDDSSRDGNDIMKRAFCMYAAQISEPFLECVESGILSGPGDVKYRPCSREDIIKFFRSIEFKTARRYYLLMPPKDAMESVKSAKLFINQVHNLLNPDGLYGFVSKKGDLIQ